MSYSITFTATCKEYTLVPIDGGRYDVNILKREGIAVYWEERKNVRDNNMFHKFFLNLKR